MEANNFWLLSIDESALSVSLLMDSGRGYSVVSSGDQEEWQEYPEDSFVVAIDKSLTHAASEAVLSSDQEPSEVAIILPPFWVASDGRINQDKLKIISLACKKMELKPIGFIPDDEAIVEQANSSDGYAASFVLLHISKENFTLSLVYLGKIKERIRKVFDGEFNPLLVESALLELNTESTLPPHIIVYGNVSDQIIQNLKNFAWIGKKDIETFLHFPDVTHYNSKELSNIYCHSIASQLKLSVNNPQIQSNAEDNEVQSEEEEEQIEVINEELPSYNFNTIEVDPSEIGFSSVTSEETQPKFEEVENVPFVEKPSQIIQEVEQPFTDPVVEQKNTPPIVKKIDFKIPKFPKINLKFKIPSLGFAPLAILPLLILIPFFFTNTTLTIFVTPYSFTKKVNVSLDSSASALDLSKGIIPVEKREFNINSSASIKTTGKKTIGEKSQGEIVIFNKQDKGQSLAKGTILTDSSGKKFELTTTVSIASSSSNLDQGIITLGQTKASVQASDIGPEYNLSKASQLNFQDISENILIAKVPDGLSGGTKQEINAVSSEDKKTLEGKINSAVIEETNNKIKNELSSLSGVINGSMQNKTSRVEYSREIGESADELNATVDASVSVFLFNPDQKSSIINGLLSSSPDYQNAQIDPESFKFTFKLDKIDFDRANGSLTIDGTSLPKIDSLALKKQIMGKSKTKTGDIIKKSVQRAYNYNIKSNMPFLDFVNPIPFLINNIKIDIKSQS